MREPTIARLMFVRYRGHDEFGNVVREFFFEGQNGTRYSRQWSDSPDGPRFELFQDYSVDELGPELDDPPEWPSDDADT